MRSFALYFLEKELATDALLSESIAHEEFDARTLRKFLKQEKRTQKSYFGNKYPHVQSNDIEDAMEEADKETRRKKPKSASVAKRNFKKKVEEILSRDKLNKKDIKKNLSCVKAMKLPSERPISHLTKRADGILTTQERKILELCSEGKSVRQIAEEIGKSFPTAWRILNAAIDKIRISHGMRPRNKDVRITVKKTGK